MILQPVTFFTNVMKTLVLGLGNPILTDDGVGVLVAQAVRDSLPLDTQIDISEVSIGGLTLMETMIGYDQVILIDSLITKQMKPGTIHRITLDGLKAISPTQHSASPHDASLITAFETGQRMGLPLPRLVTIYAIEVENVTDFSNRPTPAVAASIPLATAAVLEEISGSGQLEVSPSQ